MMSLHELVKGLRELGHKDVTLETFYDLTPSQLVELADYTTEGLKEKKNRDSEYIRLMMNFKKENRG